VPVGVVPQLTKGKPFSPVLGVSTNETIEETLQGLMHPFSLPVSLRAISRTHAQLSSSGTKNGLPKLTSESWIMIQDNREWHTMQFVDIVDEEADNFAGSVWMSN
jgi:hypothetical protein